MKGGTQMFLHHLGNELRLWFYLKRRYWFEAIGGLILVLTLFGGLVYAVVSVSGQKLASGSLDGLIVGFALWMFASISYSNASSDIGEATRQRTLEQLYLTPLPMAQLLGMRAMLELLGGLVMLVISLLVIASISAGRLQMNYPHTLGAALLAAGALMGLGYAMAGVLLLAKKAEFAAALMSPALIGLIALPAYPVNVLALLPFALGSAAAKAAATGVVLPGSVFVLIALNSATYLVLGLLIYGWGERRARALGVMGHF